jgi:hypothetical protein
MWRDENGAKRDFIPPNARDGAEFSHPQADPFTGVKGEEKIGLLRSK